MNRKGEPMIENCPMRHENGNCIPAGGFCTANKNICEALLNAYRMGKAQLSKEGTTSDLISRQAVLDAIVQCTNCGDEDTLREYVLKHSLDNGWTGGILEALDAVKDLPSVQPEPRTGKWALGFDNRYMEKYYYCSRCGGRKYGEHEPLDYFCSNCGADMRGEQDG